MLRTIFFHAVKERLPFGEERDKELIVQINPDKGKPYTTHALYFHGQGFVSASGKEISGVVAWATFPDPSHHF